MKTSACFKQRPVLSFEIFPPREHASAKTLDRFYETLDILADLKPAYISVTYGAGGAGSQTGTLHLVKYIREHYGIETVPHIPAMQFTKESVQDYLTELAAANIQNVLALRGDLPADGTQPRDFQYASDLVHYIKQVGDFNVLGACYPDVHPEAADAVRDIQNLKTKVDAGVSQLVTQLFFENDHFYHFIERCQLASIDVPIQAGIMAATSEKQIERMATMCGVTLPPKFAKMMDRYKGNKIATRDAGIAYAVDQIVDLLAHDVDGIHLYTMDNPVVAQRICDAVKTLI